MCVDVLIGISLLMEGNKLFGEVFVRFFNYWARNGVWSEFDHIVATALGQLSKCDCCAVTESIFDFANEYLCITSRLFIMHAGIASTYAKTLFIQFAIYWFNQILISLSHSMLYIFRQLNQMHESVSVVPKKCNQ